MKLKKTIDLNAIMEVGNMNITYTSILCDVVGQSNALVLVAMMMMVVVVVVMVVVVVVMVVVVVVVGAGPLLSCRNSSLQSWAAARQS